ncbi:MAG TPA: M24 family metallopeptidase [Beijerinckiaceae bacterium]|nr:M24 family metallopeptidase [Beijerinckiaceae bacterium]
MIELDPRLNCPISTHELERRWGAVRAAMQAQGIDALLMQNNNDHMGGYVKYFTDLPATNGYPTTVVFPRDDLMTVVRQGPFGAKRELNGQSDGVLRGVRRFLGTPSFASAHYTAAYDPELALTALQGFTKGTIGLVGAYQMSFALVDYIKSHLSGARFVDASDLVDRIKVIKSEEEMALCRRTARIQDGAMRAAFAALRPGMRDSEAAAVAQHYCHTHGVENGIYLCASWAEGQPVHFGGWHHGQRRMNRGDAFTLLVETNGPGGYFTELGRTAVLGRASQRLKDETRFAVEARQFTLERLKPGARPSEVFAEFNAFMRTNGRPEEARLYAHGQGYDMVERPLIRQDETMLIQQNMNVVVHPTYVKDGVLSWVCDNYAIEADGPGARMHEYPEEVTEIAV